MPLLSIFQQGTQPVQEYSRDQLQVQSGKIRLSDSDVVSKLDLFCYTKCDNNESDLIKKSRGVVYNENNIVLKGFPYTEEYTTDENSFNELKKTMTKSLDSYKFYDAHEGALLRVFFWQTKWYISTHRKLDAFRSKWASKDSFGQMFHNGLETLLKHKDERFMKFFNPDYSDKQVESSDFNLTSEFLNKLDKNYQYMFLVLNNYDNRIVCSSPEEPTLFHVGSVRVDLVNNVTKPQDVVVWDQDVGIQKPTEHTFSSWDEVAEVVETQASSELQGIIIFDTEQNKQWKLFNQEYYTLFKIRGNEPSVKYRYLQIRMDKQMVDKLYYLYPRYADAFDDYENTLYEIAKLINKNYIDRFIKKKYVTVPREEFLVMKACHDWHLQCREKNRISLRKVIDTINEQPASNLNKIIRRYKSEEVKEQIQQQPKVTRLRARSYSHNTEEYN